jgi:hypothetical protein
MEMKMKELRHNSGEHSAAHDFAKMLGWFSIGLGLAELAGPRTIRKSTGAGPKSLLRLFGLREIGAGLLILTARKPVQMVWGRVAGDALDIVALLPTLGRRNRHRLGGAGAFAFVLMATAVDVCVAMQSNKSSAGRHPIETAPPVSTEPEEPPVEETFGEVPPAGTTNMPPADSSIVPPAESTSAESAPGTVKNSVEEGEPGGSAAKKSGT